MANLSDDPEFRRITRELSDMLDPELAESRREAQDNINRARAEAIKHDGGEIAQALLNVLEVLTDWAGRPDREAAGNEIREAIDRGLRGF